MYVAVHLWWGGASLAAQRLSGRPAPLQEITTLPRMCGGGTHACVQVQLRTRDVYSRKKLLRRMGASSQCMHGGNCTATARQDCSRVLQLVSGVSNARAREMDEEAGTASRRTRFDVFVLLRQKRQPGEAEPGAPLCGSRRHGEPHAWGKSAPAERAAPLPVTMIEVVGKSIRNKGQKEMMLTKIQSCLFPEMLRGQGGAGWSGDAIADGAPWSLLFVAEDDLRRKHFRKVFARRVVMACMHEALWRCVPERAEARRLLPAAGGAVRSSVCVTYSSPRPDLWGHLLQLKEQRRDDPAEEHPPAKVA